MSLGGSIRIAIVGGGSAGWLTACLIDSLLNGASRPTKRAEIVLMESPTVPRIGVGEATVPTLVNTLRQLGIGEHEFLRAADATFKQGIKFCGWTARTEHSYYHVFDRHQAADHQLSGLRWAASTRNIPFAYHVSPQPALCDLNKAPRRVWDPEYCGAFLYAYHMDAERFADYLREVGRARGIAHILDDAVEVSFRSSDIISRVRGRNGSEIPADYFIDCTGFARVLTSRLPGFEFVPFSDWLICDRAIALQVPYTRDRSAAIAPFTKATAMSAGWAWDIGLQSRRGTGYVYSSRHIADDDAERELRAKEGPRAVGLAARRLNFTLGRLARPWVGNCVAIGLSGGFIEPMESTGIYLIEYAARTFCELLPLFGNSRLLSARFNQLMAERYEEVIDFINIHYVLSDRSDTPFWRDATSTKRSTKSNAARLQLWTQKMISPSDFQNAQQLFGYQNYEYCVYGLGRAPAELKNTDPAITPAPVVAQAVEQLSRLLPSQRDYLMAIERGSVAAE